MATSPKQAAPVVLEKQPETQAVVVPESVDAEPAARVYSPTKFVTAYDKATGEALAWKLPETHLDGRFPNLTDSPELKAGS